MECPPSVLEKAAVGYLVSQGMLKGEFTLREEARLVEELGRLEASEAAVHGVFGHLGNILQQRQEYLGTDDRRGLQELLFLWGQAVNTCCEHGLHSGGHLNAWECFGQTVCSPVSNQHLRFHQGTYALFEEEGIAL